MNDEFLHRLRKPPRPAFAARLRAQLRRQSATAPPPRVPSRARTLLTLLLLGGTAFALTAVAMRGLPPSLVALYQYATVWIGAERTTAPAHRVGNQRMGQGPLWSASGSSSAHGAALQGGTTQAAAPAMSARPAATSSAGSTAGSASVGGAPAGSQVAQISVVSSWSAYPYAAAVAERVNGTTGTAGKPIAPHIDVSVRDSDVWPGPMCSGGANAPDLAYAFEPLGTVSRRPCPRNTSGGSPSPVIAIPVGYETVLLARSPLYGELDLTRRQIFLALAKWVPDPARAGTVHENPSATWRQIDATLGPEPIAFMGPPLSSAAGRSMIELLMEGGCNTYPWIAALESTHPGRYARICRTVRTDGVYVEVSGLAAPTLLAEPNAVGIFGLHGIFGPAGRSKLSMNGLAVSKLDGIEPTQQGIQSGTYPGSRALYLFNRGRVTSNVVFSLLEGEFLPYPDWALVPAPMQELQADYTEGLTP